MATKPKTIYQSESPFTEIKCLLAPIGQYRAANITPAKGKRSKKRKRKEDKSKGEETDFPRPPPLEISSFVVVGLNSITRSLETLSQKSKADTAQLPASDDTGDTAKELLVEDVHRHFSAIFVTQASQPPILRAHLPQLVTTASLANPELPATRLVQLPKGCEARLSEALALPRVSFIGILDGAPHSKSLVDLARECVPVIEIPWLEEAKKSVYLPLKINAIESFVHVVAKKVEKSA
ncbi:hypothetical protein BGZ57DRAFT_771579 [Hyaloscypha finlandica]|nr:hypothetical protein BGZ57DRAFT_771579 [Hyaloscypha finlandica]